MNIFIEGNIGVGKSTFINKIRCKYQDQFNYIEEPIEEWTEHVIDNSETKINYLSLYYSNQAKYSFLFQCLALLSLINNKPKRKNNIIERSIYSCIYVFSKNLYNNKVISFEEYEFLKLWKKKQYKETDFKIIYLEDTVENCLERIKKRNRPEEKNITIEYLKQLEDNYKELLIKYKNNITVVKYADNLDKIIDKLFKNEK